MKDTDSGRKMTKVPGTPHFMPPEALDDNPVYDTSLDIFSYGAVTLYVITQQWQERGIILLQEEKRWFLRSKDVKII